MRHRPKKHNFENVFKSLVFCSECGSRMTFEIKTSKYTKREILVCRYHFRYPEKCKNYHYIYYKDLYDEVLKRIQKVAKGIDSGEILSKIQKQTAKNIKTDKLDAEKNKITNRLASLSKIIKRLYEDFACDVLDSSNYHNLLNDYTSEQKQLTDRLQAIQSELNKKDEFSNNLDKLKEIIQSYLEIETLSADMLNQLIERIEIGHPTKTDGIVRQEINIIYRFVGIQL